ncbi:MAG: hypothetical protein U1F57_08480 [bacterium]
MEAFLQSDPWVRLPVYVAIGLIAEVLYTAVMDLIDPKFLCSWNVFGIQAPTATPPAWAGQGRDVRARGYTFLWMMPIYAGMVFLEPIHDAMHLWPWFLRGIVYLLLIWFAEFVTGWLIEKISGRCPWDYSYSRYSFKGYIRWDFALNWFVFGFIFEYFHPRLLALTPHLRAIF